MNDAARRSQFFAQQIDFNRSGRKVVAKSFRGLCAMNIAEHSAIHKALKKRDTRASAARLTGAFNCARRDVEVEVRG